MIEELNNLLNLKDKSYSILTYDESYKYNENKKFDMENIYNILVINTLMCILISEKKIDMQDYITNYINDFKYVNIQILHLLTHSSGLDENIEYNQIFKEGTDVLFSNINIKIMEYIIENTCNKKISEISNDLIFNKLDINIIDNNSNINDISNYISMLLNNGYYNHKQYLDLNIIDLLFRPLFIDEKGIRSTIGWKSANTCIECKDYCGDDAIYYDNNNTFILVDRSNDIGILFNSNNKYNKKEVIGNIYSLLKKYDKIL